MLPRRSLKKVCVANPILPRMGGKPTVMPSRIQPSTIFYITRFISGKFLITERFMKANRKQSLMKMHISAFRNF